MPLLTSPYGMSNLFFFDYYTEMGPSSVAPQCLTATWDIPLGRGQSNKEPIKNHIGTLGLA